MTLVLAVLAAAGVTAARQKTPSLERVERASQLEGEALVALADAAMHGRPVASDFRLHWRNDYLKAQQGTFVPFVLAIDAAPLTAPAAVMYVRLIARMPARRPPARRAPAGRDERFAVEEVFPIDLRNAPAGPVRIARGFSAPPGEYDLVVVVRERVEPDRPGLTRRAGVLTRRLILPDFASDELTTSSIILADRIAVLDRPPADEQLHEHPYLIGLSEIQPAVDNVLRKDEELIVVFLVYNPFVTPERKFDIEVEYHFYSRSGESGERYFNRTKPQRFTPAIMGPQFDPAAGHPLMAGQGVPLASFPAGDYRLAIKVTDIVTGKSILRDVLFTIVS